MYHSCTIQVPFMYHFVYHFMSNHPLRPPFPTHLNTYPTPSQWIVSCENNTLTMVDLKNSNAVTRRPMKATAAIMNPVSTILALRSGNVLQMFNLDLQAKMKSSTLPSPVLFWRWTSPQNIALVTAEEVLHWSVKGDEQPVKVFDRHKDIPATSQVINYQTSKDGKWCLLGAINQGEGGGVDGHMQLYSTEQRVTQKLDGHAAR